MCAASSSAGIKTVTRGGTRRAYGAPFAAYCSATMEDVRDARPRIAAVVPCFNDGATLEATLDSLRTQEPVELVVVDDGSDDPHTLELLSALEQDGTEDRQAAEQRPCRGAHGRRPRDERPSVFALDADDLVAPGALTDLADALDREEDAVMAWGDTQMIGDATVHVPKARTLDPWQLTYVNPIPTASLIRRDALESVGGWQLGSGYEDWDLWLAFAERGWRGVHVERTVARHRCTEPAAGRRTSHDTRRSRTSSGRRHEPLFAQRRRNWRRSNAPLRSRLLLPVVFRLPFVPHATRFRLAVLVGNPIAVPRLWLQGRRARAAATPADGR